MQFNLIKSLVIVFAFLLLNGSNAEAQQRISITPMPAVIKPGNGTFTIDRNTKIVLEGSNLEKCAGFINNYLKKNTGYTLAISKTADDNNKIVLNYERMDNKLPGAYVMNITGKEVYIAGDNEEGVFYGIQTLLQLIPAAGSLPVMIPQLSITDRPRFEYRGMHLDAARHFFSVQQVKQYIDFMAAYKFNRFHWHLTEDQGWRIEIKKYPKLTSVGAYRNGTIIGHYPGNGNDSIRYGGFYTQKQIREIVAYAKERYIEVIPEIEMPGHSSAAIAAYPQLSCFPAESTAISPNTPWAGAREGKQVQQTWGVFEDVLCPSEYTFGFLQDVLDEVMQLFPSKYIHIGGDECPKESWKRSAFCQQLIKDKKLKDEHELQSYFIQRIERYINKKGKKIIGWDEILEGGLAPNATVMSWRGEAGGIAAAKQDHDVIMTPENPLYINHAQSKMEDSVTQGGYNPLEAVYNYEPVPNELSIQQSKHILGAQGNMWSEYINNEQKLEYMLFPRMMALSEVLWTPREKRSWEDFEKRLPYIFKRLDDQKINFSKAYYNIKATVSPSDNSDGLNWVLETNNKDGSIVYKDATSGNSWISYTHAIPVTHSGTYAAALMGAGRQLISNPVTQSFIFNKATGKKITLMKPASGNYPGNGAFTLVDGVQNEKGMGRSSEFLGFSGTDLEAIIDLGSETAFKTVTINTFTETGSWIYPPRSASFSISHDGVNFTSPETEVSDVEPYMGRKTRLRDLSEQLFNARYIKVTVKNYGIIPAGKPGAGNPAWLFVDEIEID